MTTKPPKRKTATDRRIEILAVALEQSLIVGYQQITRERVSFIVGITKQAVQYHIGSMAELRQDVMHEAIRRECLPVIAQGMAAKDSIALGAPTELLERARAAL
jgi:hypothetical protein